MLAVGCFFSFVVGIARADAVSRGPIRFESGRLVTLCADFPPGAAARAPRVVRPSCRPGVPYYSPVDSEALLQSVLLQDYVAVVVGQIQ